MAVIDRPHDAPAPLALDRRREPGLIALIAVMALVTAGYPSYLAHPVTLLAPIPLLVALLVLDDGRLTAPVWAGAASALAVWSTLLYLATGASAAALIHAGAMIAPFAALAFRTRRPEPVAVVFAVITSALVCLRVVISFVRAGGQWVPWQVYEGNEMSARLNTLLPLVIVGWLTVPADRRGTRALLLCLIAAGAGSVVLAQERAGLGVLAILVVIGVARTNWRWLLVLGAAVVAAWVVASAWIESILERVRFVNFVPSNASRPEIWDLAIDGLRDSSWLGVGPGNSDVVLREVGGGHAHNSLIQTALETGWPGALLIGAVAVYLVVLAGKLLWRGGRSTLWSLSILGYLGFSVVSAPIVRPDFTLALVLVVMGAREQLDPRGDPWRP